MFYVWPCHIKAGKGKYCSTKCSGKSKISKVGRHCSVSECNSPIATKGYCNRHYLRQYRGNPIDKKSCYELTLNERFYGFFEVDELTGCWLWTGGKNKKGYGQFKYKMKSYIAHRLSYELHVGTLTPGMLVCHSCDTPPCVNPSHLFLGTNQDNTDDKFKKGRNRHANGMDNGNRKLTDDNVVEIKSLLKGGESYAAIGRLFGVRGENISFIAKGKTWSHINE